MAALLLLVLPANAEEPPAAVIDIGSRRELLIDDFLVDSLTASAVQRLHHPVRKEIAIVHDAPWEGNGGGYHAIFHDFLDKCVDKSCFYTYS